jgi:predicted DNA-binding transcriptional regulator AlpA
MRIQPKTAGLPLGIEMLSATQLRCALGVCRMTVDRMVARDPAFPRPMKLAGSNRKFFLRTEVEAWLRANREQVAL